MVAMKVRSFVLIACMLIVPALALFSHLTPPSVRQFLRQMGQQAVDAATASPAPSRGIASASAPKTAPDPAPVPAPTPPVRAFAATPPPVVLPSIAVPATPAPAASLPRDVPRSQQEWATLAELRERLIALGATAIDCKPGPGNGSLHTCSCRVAVDAEGQLHRMFHGVGPDAALAMRSLLDRVEAWRAQQAAAPNRRS